MVVITKSLNASLGYLVAKKIKTAIKGINIPIKVPVKTEFKADGGVFS
jgi:hypothetical protein